MTWELLAQLIVKVGLQAAYEIWQKAEAGNKPTHEDWLGILAVGTKPSDVYLAEARARLGLPASPVPATAPAASPPVALSPGAP
jgi:hypothetical protein